MVPHVKRPRSGNKYVNSLLLLLLPRAGSGVVRIDPLHFLTGCTRRQNQALSVLSPGLGFLSVSVVLLTRATCCVVILC